MTKRIHLMFNSRINRKNYLIGNLIFFAFDILVGIEGALILYLGFFGIDTLKNIIYIESVIGMVFKFSLFIRRLHDTNKPWFFTVLLFIPLLNLFLIYSLFFKKGDLTNNKFGKPDVNNNYTYILLGK